MIPETIGTVGFIYMLYNDCFSDKVKIGSTENPVNRFHNYTTYYEKRYEKLVFLAFNKILSSIKER